MNQPMHSIFSNISDHYDGLCNGELYIYLNLLPTSQMSSLIAHSQIKFTLLYFLQCMVDPKEQCLKMFS